MTTKPFDRRRTDLPGPEKRFFSDELLDQAWPPILGHAVSRRIILSLFTAVTLYVDYLTGPIIRFPAFFVAPVLLFAWYDGYLWGCLAGAFVIATRFTLESWIWTNVPWHYFHSLVNLSTALFITVIVVWFVARAGRLTREVRLLWGLLPICMYCHRIRNEENEWEKLESYITERAKVEFSHGICPRCMKEKIPPR